MKRLKIVSVWVIFILVLHHTVKCDRVFLAQFNMAGIIGTVRFIQENYESMVTIEVDLRGLWIDEDVNMTWAVHPFPVNYHSWPLCHENQIGLRQIDLTKTLGFLQLSSKLNTTDLSLWGSNTIQDKTLLIQFNQTISCATILNSNPQEIRTIKSLFVGPVAGYVLFRQNIETQKEPTSILIDLFHVSSNSPSNHQWKILATEVFESKVNEDKCDRLHVIYDTGIKNENTTATGDLTKKHGLLSISRASSKFSIKRLMDENLWFPDLTVSARRLFLVLYDKEFSDTVYACAPLVEMTPREIIAEMTYAQNFDEDEEFVHASVRVVQNSPLDLPIVELNVGPFASAISVCTMPVEKRISKDDDLCKAVGKQFNPFEISNVPETGNGTFDLFPVGDLGGKYGDVIGNYTDPYLQLFGRHSVIGRSITINLHDNSTICATLQYTRPVITLEAVFVHPIAGRVIFQQLEDEPTSETTVLVEGLLYADDHMNDTHSHRWMVFSSPVGGDFLNWTKRCQSAGDIFDPSVVQKIPKSQPKCGGDDLRCAVGDLARKAGLLDIVARRHTISTTRRFHVDVNLPLNGRNSVSGRTLGIIDDFAPAFRGNRMACALIRRTVSLTATVQNWRSAEPNITVYGSINFKQETVYSSSETLMHFSQLNGQAEKYAIHETPVPLELDFPCGEDTVQGLFNPFEVGKSKSDLDSSQDIPVGDLSGKYGSLKDSDEYSAHFLDTNLPLHGPNSILERSVVIYKENSKTRWLCGNIQLNEPKDAKIIRALASFHAPNGFAYGYARFTQLVLKNGGMSDTWIEIDLKYPGVNNKNLTKGHHWAIYVNPVGYDATVKPQKDRCVAAGFKWNPFLVVDSLSDYRNECSAWTPLRCVMGDVSFRQTTLDVGGKAKIFTDSNLQLVGKHSIMDRSIVIFDKLGSENRFACANINKEKYAVIVITIINPRYFSSALFMDQAREVLGVPPWLMFADAQKTKYVLDDACVQMTIHFRGWDVEWIQQIFMEMLSKGYVSRYTPSPSRSDSKKKRFGYRLCRTDINSSRKLFDLWREIFLVPVMVVVNFLI